MADFDPLGPAHARGRLTASPAEAKGRSAGELASLMGHLGHEFGRPELLSRALTHTSVDSAAGRAATYERLEFLGDRVLGLIVAEMLLEHFPNAAESELAPRFNELVRRESVAKVARDLGLGAHFRLGPGEHQTGGRNKIAILADVGEAVIAALYLDGGLDVAKAFIRRHWTPLIGEQTTPPRDGKTVLQEWSQARGLGLPDYRQRTRTGPDHAPRFTIEVGVEGFAPAVGTGASKREAERLAAEAFLAREDIGDDSRD